MLVLIVHIVGEIIRPALVTSQLSHFSKMISTVKIRNNNNSKGVREKQVLPQTKAT